MADKNKEPIDDEEEDELPEGKVDEEGDEVIDLYDEKDNLEEDLEYDLNKVQDDMLQDESESEEIGYDVSDIEKMLRKLDCEPCTGSDSKRNCKVRDDFGCPPGKEAKKKPWTDAERRAAGKHKRSRSEENEEENED